MKARTTNNCKWTSTKLSVSWVNQSARRSLGRTRRRHK